jgi:Flp pilus assembly pilin Flp
VVRTLHSRLTVFCRNVSRLLECFVEQEDGQDLVEYALLAAFVATAGMLVLLNLSSDIANVYSSWLNPSTGVPSLWDPETSVTSGS